MINPIKYYTGNSLQKLEQRIDDALSTIKKVNSHQILNETTKSDNRQIIKSKLDDIFNVYLNQKTQLELLNLENELKGKKDIKENVNELILSAYGDFKANMQDTILAYTENHITPKQFEFHLEHIKEHLSPLINAKKNGLEKNYSKQDVVMYHWNRFTNLLDEIVELYDETNVELDKDNSVATKATMRVKLNNMVEAYKKTQIESYKALVTNKISKAVEDVKNKKSELSDDMSEVTFNELKEIQNDTMTFTNKIETVEYKVTNLIHNDEAKSYSESDFGKGGAIHNALKDIKNKALVYVLEVQKKYFNESN